MLTHCAIPGYLSANVEFVELCTQHLVETNSFVHRAKWQKCVNNKRTDTHRCTLKMCDAVLLTFYHLNIKVMK